MFADGVRVMSIFFMLSREARATSVIFLGIGRVAIFLESIGLVTLGDLLRQVELDSGGFRKIPGVSPEDEMHLRKCLSLVELNIDSRGDVAWDDYSRAMGLLGYSQKESPVVSIGSKDIVFSDSDSEGDWPGAPVPAREIANGFDFILALPEVIEAIVASRENEADRAILVERLICPLGQRKTLEQVASLQTFPITRERIRQRESKLLAQLCDAFLHGRFRRLGVSFRPSFICYWKIAAEQFGDAERISFNHFIEGLETAWGVPAEQIFDHLPIIASVLTRKAVFPESLRTNMRRGFKIYRKINDADAGVPVTMLAVGRAADDLSDIGIETIGELFEAARGADGFGLNRASGQTVEKVISALVEALGDDGRIDWRYYQKKLGLVRLPLHSPLSAEEFLATLNEGLVDVIRTNKYTLRASEIFRRRIAVPRMLRPTLAETAENLGTHGSSIKREESVLLSGLNDQLVARDMTHSSVAFCQRYLGYWAEAENAYLNCSGDFRVFCSIVASRWNLEPGHSLDGAETLWAVINRYPGGRPPRKRKRGVAIRARQGASELVGIVMLRGFRRVH